MANTTPSHRPQRSRPAKPRRRRWRTLALLLVGLTLLAVWVWWAMVRMPGERFTGELPPLTASQRALANELREHVTTLAATIGERNFQRSAQLAAAADHIAATFAAAGHVVERQSFPARDVKCENLIVERRGGNRPTEIVLVGAHYDSVIGCPGANDNGSGTAALLTLARRWRDRTASRTVRFVAWTNEEPPNYRTEDMGSVVHAKACRARGDDLVAVLSLETLGCYHSEPGSQRYPFPFGLFYPSTGDFVAFVGDRSSSDLVRDCVGLFRGSVQFPCEGGALPGWLPGVGWSDHWAYWQAGYRGVMLTDTAPFRYSHYHRPTDTAEKVDCERLARVVEGVDAVITALAER